MVYGKKGQNLDFKELYTMYATKVLAICYRYTRDYETAKDLTHDTMIRVMQNAHKYRGENNSSIYSWIRRIAINLSIDYIRKTKAPDLSPKEEDLALIPEQLTESILNVPRSALKSMIDSLPHTQRLIINMFCIDGYTHKEIAERLGITEKTSSSLLAKAKRKMNSKIESYLKTH